MLTNHDAWKIYKRYTDGWRAVSDADRATIASEVLADRVEYRTPRHVTGDRETALADMAAFQQSFPGGHFDIGDVSAHDDVALLTWILVRADGTEMARGHDQIRISASKQIASLITFAPSVTAP